MPQPQNLPAEASRAQIRAAVEDLDQARVLVDRFDPTELWPELFLAGFCTTPRMVSYSSSLPANKLKFKMPGLGKIFWSLPLSILATPPDRITEMVHWILERTHPSAKPIDPKDGDSQSPF